MNFREEFIKLHARQILDSRGEPTVEVDLVTRSGVFRASFPSGKSRGVNEAFVKIDKGKTYDGKSVKKVVEKINNTLNTLLISNIENFGDQEKFDRQLELIDGTIDFHRFGANAILPISICYARASAFYSQNNILQYINKISRYPVERLIPEINFNVLNGGVHSENNLAFQEIMINFPNEPLEKVLEKCEAFYNELERAIEEIYGSKFLMIGDEAGFAPPIKTLEEGLNLLYKANEKLKYDFRIAIDSAANNFCDKTYNFYREKMGFPVFKKHSGQELLDYYKNILREYPKIYLIEDPFHENDIESWKKITEETNILIVGDDLCVSHPSKIEKALRNKICNSILIKPNQVGNVFKTIEAINKSREFKKPIMVSHRSGETEDIFIVELACGVGAEFIKCGAPRRGERISKYNQLLRISEWKTK